MRQKDSLLLCYERTAKAYASQFADELDGKSLDRLLLKRFAEELTDKGPVADLGCGPGQTTRFLAQHGLNELIGLDISPAMIDAARRFQPPPPEFLVGDMLQLPFPDNSLAGLLSFYGIVHFTEEELAKALREMYRVLQPGGQLLFSFHVGTEVHELSEFLGEEVQITFYYFELEKVLNLLKITGFQTKEIIERHPYQGVEYPSKRAYLLVEK